MAIFFTVDNPYRRISISSRVNLGLVIPNNYTWRQLMAVSDVYLNILPLGKLGTFAIFELLELLWGTCF